jgi:YaiO family outer membrane protein
VLIGPVSLVLSLVAALPAASQTGPDWQAAIRLRAADDHAGALAIADERLARRPDDLEARGWRARILGWMGRWQDAEVEYRRVLERAPRDVEILVGLGRALRALDRAAEARAVFVKALAIDPGNVDAKQGLASVQPEPRHEFAVSTDLDEFNFTPEDGQAYAGGLRSRWTPRWSTVFGVRFDRRFGASAGRWTSGVTAKLTPRSVLTVGGSFGRDGGIVSQGELVVEYGRGFAFDRRRIIGGLELTIQQRELWFDEADVFTLTPGAIVYLPNDWMWSVAVTAARSSYPDVGTEWRPSGQTRVTFPLASSVTGHVLVAAGTENFALADQIGRFSALTVGGGARISLPGGREVAGYFAHQVRTRGRAQQSVGFTYVVRF